MELEFWDDLLGPNSRTCWLHLCSYLGSCFSSSRRGIKLRRTWRSLRTAQGRLRMPDQTTTSSPEAPAEVACAVSSGVFHILTFHGLEQDFHYVTQALHRLINRTLRRLCSRTLQSQANTLRRSNQNRDKGTSQATDPITAEWPSSSRARMCSSRYRRRSRSGSETCKPHIYLVLLNPESPA